MKPGRERDVGRSTSRKRSPRFFKIVLDSALQHGKLRLPKSLVIEHRESLSNHVRLRVQNSGMWRMEVIKMEGHVWFQDGWPQFAEFYSIRHGYLLVFRYIGNSIFHVLIFDRTEKEITYPHPPKSRVAKKSKPHEQMKDKEDYDFVEILDEFLADRKRKSNAASKGRAMAPKVRAKGNESGGTMQMEGKKENDFVEILDEFPANRGRKSNDASKGRPMAPKVRPKGNESGGTCMQMKGKKEYDSVEILDEFPANRKRKSNAASKGRSIAPKVRSKGNENGGTMRKKSNLASSSGQENTAALQKAKAFQSENPFFVRVMKATYASGCYLAIPASFVGEYLAEMEDGSTFTLRALDGSSWKVNYYSLQVGSSAGKFSGGWKAFVDAWQLRVGDVCVFELVKQTEMQFQVFIFKN